MLCHHDYAKKVAASFAHQIQSEYYGGNIFVSIRGIALDHFIVTTQLVPLSAPLSCTRHSLFHSVLYDDSKTMRPQQPNTASAS